MGGSREDGGRKQRQGGKLFLPSSLPTPPPRAPSCAAAGQQCPKAHDLSLPPSLGPPCAACAMLPRHFVAFYVPPQLPSARKPFLPPSPLGPVARASRLARRAGRRAGGLAAAVIIIFCSHGAFRRFSHVVAVGVDYTDAAPTSSLPSRTRHSLSAVCTSSARFLLRSVGWLDLSQKCTGEFLGQITSCVQP